MLKYLIFDSRREINFCQFGQQTESRWLLAWSLGWNMSPHNMSSHSHSHQLSAQNSIKIKIKQIGWKQKAHVLNTIFIFPHKLIDCVWMYRSWLIIDLWLNPRFAWHNRRAQLLDVLMRLFLFTTYFPITVNDFIKTKMLVCHN